MTTTDKVLTFALPALALAAILGFMGWHASIVDRAASRHFACVDAHKADGMASREAHDACVAQGFAH